MVQGTSSGHLRAYRADTGEQLADIDVGTAIMAAPVSYQIGDDQYIAVLAGFGGALAPVYPKEIVAYKYQNYGRLLAFKLGGAATPLPPLRQALKTPEPPQYPGLPDAMAARGATLFASKCSLCHGGRGEAQLSAYPDLHRIPAAIHAVFDSIVLGGKLSSMGMASFADVLKADDVQAIHAYLLKEQRTLWKEEQGRP